MAATAPPVAPPAAASSEGRPLVYYGYWLVGVALLAQFVSAGTQAWVAGIFMVPMTEDLGWSRSEFTLAQTLGRFLMAGVGIFVGTHIDRNGGRGLMVVGVTVLGMGLFLTSGVQELWQWILLRGAMFTVGAALIGNLVVNVTLSKWFVEKRGRVIGIAAMGVSLGGVILPPVLTPIVDEYGWRVGWQLLAVMAWLLIYPASLLMRRAPEDHGLNPDGKSDEEMAAASGDAARADFANSLTRGEALRTRALYMIVFAFGLASIGLGVMLLQTIPFLTDQGYSRTTAAFMLTLFAIPAAVSKPVWGLLMERISPKVLASSGFIMSAIAMVVIVISARTGGVTALAGGFLLLGTGIGGQIPLQEMIWASYFGRRYLGAVRSVAMPFALFLGAGGPFVVSLYFDVVGNYDGAFFAVGVLWLVAAVLVLFVRKPARPERAAVPFPDSSVDPDRRGPNGDGAARPAPVARPAPAGNGAVASTDGARRPIAQPVGSEHGGGTVAAPRSPARPPRDYMQAGG